MSAARFLTKQYLIGISHEFMRDGKAADVIRGNIISGDGLGQPEISDFLCPKKRDDAGKKTGERVRIPGITRRAAPALNCTAKGH